MDEEERINHNAINNLITLRDAAELEAGETLESVSDYDELKHEREERTYNAMEAIEPSIAKETLPPSRQDLSEEDKRLNAAIVIQSHYRGYLDRCRYLELLYDVYEKEEEERRVRAAQQVEEGELLVANHQLEVDLEDAETAAKNKQRLYQTHIITIQRAWRSYKRRQIHNSARKTSSVNHIGDEEECSSPGSRRKNDILSRAQEFADLKKRCDTASPHHAHRATLLSDSSSESSRSNSALSSPEHSAFKAKKFNPFQKPSTDSEVTLPQLDWSQFDHSLGGKSQATSRGGASSSKTIKDREGVMKRLAMNTPFDGSYGEVYSRPPPKPYRGQNSAMELYVNDCNDETSGGKSPLADADADLVSKQQRLQEEATVAYVQAGPIAKKLIEFEKMAEEPSQIARMLGISTFRSKGENTLSKKRLKSLTLAQLQIVYNAMQNEIERLNEELVEIVVSRDELHMQQDSILVNVEDLQRRMEELSTKHEKKMKENETKSTTSTSKESQQKPPTSSRMSRLFRLGKT